MELRDLKLEEISFSAPPTKTQTINLLRDIHRFLSRVGGALVVGEEFSIADQAVGQMLNASIGLKAAADLFENGPNQAGLVHAMPAPPANPRGSQRV